MKKLLTISLLSTLSIFAKEALVVDNSMPWMRVWLIASLLTVALMFWSIYKAMKTKNPRYGWGMALSILLLVVLLFI